MSVAQQYVPNKKKIKEATVLAISPKLDIVHIIAPRITFMLFHETEIKLNGIL